MQILMPVYLYDVTTADGARVIVTCRNADTAHALASRLREMHLSGQLAGDEDFTAAPPRLSAIPMQVEPGSSVTVRGYEVASEVVAQALAAAAGATP